MGGRSSKLPRIPQRVPYTTEENAYGFEVQRGKDLFSDATWAEMADLQAIDSFRDRNLADRVDERMGQLRDYATDEMFDLQAIINDSATTEDEYWAAYHTLADMLAIRRHRRAD